MAGSVDILGYIQDVALGKREGEGKEKEKNMCT